MARQNSVAVASQFSKLKYKCFSENTGVLSRVQVWDYNHSACIRDNRALGSCCEEILANCDFAQSNEQSSRILSMMLQYKLHTCQIMCHQTYWWVASTSDVLFTIYNNVR